MKVSIRSLRPPEMPPDDPEWLRPGPQHTGQSLRWSRTSTATIYKMFLEKSLKTFSVTLVTTQSCLWMRQTIVLCRWVSFEITSEDVTRWLPPCFIYTKKMGFLILRIFKLVGWFSKCDFWIPGEISDRPRWSEKFSELFFEMKKLSKHPTSWRFWGTFEFI